MLRRAVALIEERVFFLGAALALEVGKNRMEALGEAQETADLIAYYCDQMEANDGLLEADGTRSARRAFASENRSVLKPHGVWLVIAPFNFPFALAGGPSGAALVAGNTVVFKAASATAWSGRLLADAFRDAGLPPGVFNYLSGPGGSLGEALIRHPDVAGATFTGSFDVGMHLVRTFARGALAAPMHRGNGRQERRDRHAGMPRIDDAALGVMRSAFGLSGQKCSACSRVYVEHTVFADFVAALHAADRRDRVGDPTAARELDGTGDRRGRRRAFRGRRARRSARSDGDGVIDHGGMRLDRGELAHGHYCAPTIARAPLDHPLWRRELFAPFVLVAPVADLDEGARARQRGRLRAHRGLLRIRGRDRAFLRGASRPASATRTGRRARRRAPGPDTSRSAAGRAPVPRARPAARSTTFRSTCASSRRRACAAPERYQRSSRSASRASAPRSRRWRLRVRAIGPGAAAIADPAVRERSRHVQPPARIRA